MRSEAKVSVPDGETVSLLFIQADGMTDIDITALRVDWANGVTFWLVRDGYLHDGPMTEPIGDYNSLEPQAPHIACDDHFEVRLKNESGSVFNAVAIAQYVRRHANRGPLPSRIKVKPNKKLRRRFIRDP